MQNLQCFICKKYFARKSTLQLHIRNKSCKLIIKKCNICGKESSKFRQYHNFLRHLRCCEKKHKNYDLIMLHKKDCKKKAIVTNYNHDKNTYKNNKKYKKQYKKQCNVLLCEYKVALENTNNKSKLIEFNIQNFHKIDYNYFSNHILSDPDVINSYNLRSLLVKYISRGLYLCAKGHPIIRVSDLSRNKFEIFRDGNLETVNDNFILSVFLPIINYNIKEYINQYIKYFELKYGFQDKGYKFFSNGDLDMQSYTFGIKINEHDKLTYQFANDIKYNYKKYNERSDYLKAIKTSIVNTNSFLSNSARLNIIKKIRNILKY